MRETTYSSSFADGLGEIGSKAGLCRVKIFKLRGWKEGRNVLGHPHHPQLGHDDN